MQEFNMIESALNFHYRRGILITDAQVGIKLTENAMAGNITAHQQLTKIREQQRLTDLKNRYLYGEEID